MMTINEKPVGKRPGYAAQAVKIVAMLIAAGLAGAGLIYLGNQIDGVLRWVCFIAGGACSSAACCTAARCRARCSANSARYRSASPTRTSSRCRCTRVKSFRNRGCLPRAGRSVASAQ